MLLVYTSSKGLPQNLFNLNHIYTTKMHRQKNIKLSSKLKKAKKKEKKERKKQAS